MYIKFVKIRWKNFLSNGNVWIEIELDKHQNTLIHGRSGSGKSSIEDALCYVLFNKPFRNINKPQLKNSVNQKNTLVEIEFTIGRDEFFVRRGMSPNVFEIIKNGKLIDPNASTRDYQDVLETNYLKMNYKTFKQVVILGSASFTPFMQLTAAARREVIEDLLDIQIFSVMNTLLKEKVLNNNKELTEIDYKLELINEKIKLHESHLKSINEDISERVNEINSRINSINIDKDIEEAIIDEKIKFIKELNNKIKPLPSLVTKSSKMDVLINQLEDKIKKLEKEELFFKEHENCPTCLQVIDIDFRNKTIEQKQKNREDTIKGLKELEAKHSELSKNISDLEMIKRNINDDKVDISIRQNKVKNYNENISDLNKQLQKLNKSITKIDTNSTTREFEADRDKISLDKKRLIETKELFKAALVILKDNGIKSQIIKQYVPKINKLINKYLSALDLFIQFELDETFNETIRSRYRDDFSYESFSEGEKMRIDLALLFTWRMISKMRNSASTNLLIMDEIFESHLDETGIDNLIKMLTSFVDSNIILISHSPNVKEKMEFGNVLYFEKKNSFSTMIKENI